MEAEFILQKGNVFLKNLEGIVIAKENFEEVLENKNKRVFIEESEVRINDRKYSLENIEIITPHAIYYPKNGDVYLGDFREEMVKKIKCYLRKK